MRKRAFAASAALLIATAVGCSSSDDGNTAVEGIATLTANDNGRVVRVYDPTSGKLVLTSYFSVGEGSQQTLANCNNPGEASAFTPDYSGMAASQAYGTGRHVGILKATDGPQKVSEFKDLSGDTESKTKPVTQTTGAFGPDGKLYTLEKSDAGKVIRVIDPASGKSETLNAWPTWTELDESGNTVTREAVVEDTEDSTPTKPYFLPRGKNIEVDPSGHKVYSLDGKWAFETPEDTHVTRGNLQTPQGERYTVDMPEQPSGGVDPVAPFMVQSEDTGLFVSYGGRKVYAGKFLREELDLNQIALGNKGQLGGLAAAPDNKVFAYIDTTDAGSSTLHIATIDGAKAKTERLAKLDRNTCLLSWQ